MIRNAALHEDDVAFLPLRGPEWAMKPDRRFRVVAALSAILLASAVLVVLCVARAPAAPALDTELDTQLTELEQAVDDPNGEQDDRALQLIDVLAQSYADLRPGDQLRVRKVLDVALNDERVRRPPDSCALYIGAATALSGMGHDGAEILEKALDNRKFWPRQWVGLRVHLLACLGNTKDDAMIKALVDVARRSPEPAVLAAAGEALENFGDQPLKVRKGIVKDLIYRYCELYARVQLGSSGDAQMQRSRETLVTITEPWNRTLGKLTRHQFQSAAEWHKFWYERKHEDWDR